MQFIPTPICLGEVFDAPLDVILSPRDVVEPALIVVSDASQVTRRAIDGPPLLLVEILSPTSFERDRIVKAARYAALGVPHYWIVDLDARAIYPGRDGALRAPVARRSARAAQPHRSGATRSPPIRPTGSRRPTAPCLAGYYVLRYSRRT